MPAGCTINYFSFFLSAEILLEAKLKAVVAKQVKKRNVDPTSVLKQKILEQISEIEITEYLKRRKMSKSEETESKSKTAVRFSTITYWLHKYAHLELCITPFEENSRNSWNSLQESRWLQSHFRDEARIKMVENSQNSGNPQIFQEFRRRLLPYCTK